MSWTIEKVENVTPSMLFDLARAHGLVPDNVQNIVRCYHGMSAASAMLYVKSGGEKTATVIISAVVPGETAELDLIPVSQYFRSGYVSELREVMEPLWAVLFIEMGLRRVTSWVPESRVRTIRALKSLGFEEEGVQRQGIRLRDKAPEHLVMLGLLAEDTDMEVL